MRSALVSLTLVLAAACFVPPHRFDDPPPPDGQPLPDAAPLVFLPIPSGVSIQGGSSLLGLPEPMTNYDSAPVHRVFTSGFEMTSRCVSEQQYAACARTGACPELPDDGGQIGLGQIGRAHAEAYCTSLGARLPTEAELERAMRGDAGLTTIPPTSPFGIEPCDLGRTTVIVADNYQCDAYVGRSWANPREADGEPHARFFITDANPPVEMPARNASSPVYGIRCVRTLDTTPPPAPPTQPICTSNCDVTQLALGERFGCALRAGGGVWCWGSNLHGELGTDAAEDAMPASTADPILSASVEIGAGARFACSRGTDGSVQCWGDNSAGQIAGSSLSLLRKPTLVATDATDLAVSEAHGCIVLADTSVSCWGHGSAIASGTGPTQLTATGITGATAVAAGTVSECAIVGTSVRCWGTIYDAGGTQVYASPANARTFSLAATQIAVGNVHWCAVVGTSVQCWGIRAFWGGGSGVAVTPEAVAGTFVSPKVFLSSTGTVIVDQGAIALDVGTAMPSTLGVDGESIAFSPGSDSSGCATTATGASCFGIERGQLGRSNGCDATPATSALVLP